MSMKRVISLLPALGHFTATLLMAWSVALLLQPRTAGFDWDEVLMLAMGFAGFAYVVADLKRERRLDECAMDHEGRIANVEALLAAQDDTLLTRVIHLEARKDHDDRLEERVCGYAERIAVLEEKAVAQTSALDGVLERERARLEENSSEDE